MWGMMKYQILTVRPSQYSAVDLRGGVGAGDGAVDSVWRMRRRPLLDHRDIRQRTII